MPRKREIHPGFFKNEDIAELEPLARLLLIGMWTIADREGRIEDRPKKIKMEVLAGDDCDADKLIANIAEKGFIVRYEVQGNKYIQIVNWDKYQHVHPKETPSIIPSMEKNDLGCTQGEPKDDSSKIQDESFRAIPSFTSFPSSTSFKRDIDDNAREAELVDKSPKPDFTLFRELSATYGILSTVEMSCLTEWHELFADDILTECFKRYKDKSGKNRSYMDSIFVNWHKAGVKTLDEVWLQDEIFERDKHSQYTPRGKLDNVTSLMEKVLGGTSSE